MKVLRVPYKMLAKPVPLVPYAHDKTALLLMDFQKFTCDRAAGLGQMAQERGIATEFVEYYEQVDAAVQNSQVILAACRKAGLPVFFTFFQVGKDGLQGHQFASMGYRLPTTQEMKEQYLPGLQPQQEDKVIVRNWYSPFLNTILAQRLEQRGITNLIVTGTLFNYSGAMAVREAADLGFNVAFVWDASASDTNDWHQTFRTGLPGGLIISRRTHEVLEMLEGSRL